MNTNRITKRVCPKCRRADKIHSALIKPKIEVKAGQIWHDKKGLVSECIESTYVVLSGERVMSFTTDWEWRVAKFHWGGTRWWGASVHVLWDRDMAKLKYIGEIQSSHWKPKV